MLCNSVGKLGITAIPNNRTKIIIVGKYHIKLDEPNTIGDEIINPKIAFLESVKQMNITKATVINEIKYLCKEKI